MADLFQYCTLLYERLEQESTTNDDGIVTWSGKLIATCTDLNIPRGSYQRVVKVLRNTGCLEQTEQGKRGVTPTTFILHKPPTPETRDALAELPRRLTTAPNYDRLSQEVSDLDKRIGGMDIPEAFLEVEKRLDAITARLNLMQQQQQHGDNANNEGEKIA